MKSERKITRSAGFLPRQGSKAQGIGFEWEIAPTMRTVDTGGGINNQEKICRKQREKPSLQRLRGMVADPHIKESDLMTGR